MLEVVQEKKIDDLCFCTALDATIFTQQKL